MRVKLAWWISLTALSTSACLAACGSDPAKPAHDPDQDAGYDASADVADAYTRVERATGSKRIARKASLAGVTSDGFIVFTELDANGHEVAKVAPIDGGDPSVEDHEAREVTIATSTGQGKSDLRFELHGGVVFVWADRGNRAATLTIWSRATGAVVVGSGVRPGRAAASLDGKNVAFMRDANANTASIVAGPIGGPYTLVGTMNALDNDCWRGADLASVGGTTAPHFVTSFCNPGSTSFILRSSTPDGQSSVDLSSALGAVSYGRDRLVWREVDGALKSADPDGGGVVALADGVAEHRLAREQGRVVFRTLEGAIASTPPDGGTIDTAVAAPGAVQLGAVSPDGRLVFFASTQERHKSDDVAPYTDVKVASFADGGAPRTLVTGATSCPGCLYDPFTPDGTFALTLEPIDNSQSAGGVGPLRVFDLSSGAEVSSFGKNVYTTIALGPGAGLATRFLLVETTPDAALTGGHAYTLMTRSLGPGEVPNEIVVGAELVALDATRSRAVYSFAEASPLAGIWVAPLQ